MTAKKKTKLTANALRLMVRADPELGLLFRCVPAIGADSKMFKSLRRALASAGFEASEEALREVLVTP